MWHAFSGLSSLTRGYPFRWSQTRKRDKDKQKDKDLGKDKADKPSEPAPSESSRYMPELVFTACLAAETPEDERERDRRERDDFANRLLNKDKAKTKKVGLAAALTLRGSTPLVQ